ncbi:PepSY-associated TM helix domain-containing protein [Sphingomonas sp. ac-8]|uniref:PepSY-associated TM helix domain-containing protein n=1 Tax=Sphingomonas sp. ac-8 TaxID=3242977 RepID=UPI003A7F8077
MHLWIGVVLGALFALVGLTGSALVFYRGIDGALHPAVRSAPGARPDSWEAVLAALRRADPTLAGGWRIEVPPEGGIVPARYMATPESLHRGFAPRLAWVDPTTGQVVRQEQWGERGLSWIYDLHYRLLAGPAGGTLLGVVGLLCLVLMASGIYLWWPATGRWRIALTVKRNASAQRHVYDLHNVSGVYGLVLLAGVTLTGALLELPGQVHPLLAQMSPLFVAPTLHSAGTGPRISVDAAVAVATQRFPGARLAWIETPADAHGVYRITLAQPHEPSQRFPRTTVWIDARSARVLAVRDPRADGRGDVLLNWLHPLHNGEAFGLFGRLLVFASGLLPAVLFVTGILRWRHKARARHLLRARRSPIRCVPEARPAPACAIASRSSQSGART